MILGDINVFPDELNINYHDNNTHFDVELEEINRKLAEKEAFEKSLPEALEDIQGALCEVAEMTAEGETSIEDLMDAVTELAELVAQVIGD